jgi:L-iditol 2-dehydrogenase
MKGCVFHGPGDLKVEEREVRRPGPGEVLFKTKAASLCYSDIRVYKGEKYAQSGVILGHEMAGEIVELGEDVSEVEVGQGVAICPIMACGSCHFCIRGKRNRCLNRQTLGYDGDGGLAEYVLVPQQLVSLGHLLKLPQGLPWEIACQVEPFACALYSMLVLGVGPGTSLTIVGAGPMGLTHLLIARSMGCGAIIVADPVEERLAVADELGATAVVNPQRQSVKEEVMKLTDGLGTDASVASVGNVDAIQSSVDAVRKQGIVNIFGGCPPGSVLPVDPNRVHYDELWITGTQNANPEHYEKALELLNHMPHAQDLTTHRFSIDDAPKAFEARGQMDGLKAVLNF